MDLATLGRYQLVRELGRGTAGRLFLARDPLHARDVALRTIDAIAALPELERETARRRVLREARTAATVAHPAIAAILEVGDADGVPFVATEYVDGEPLDRFCSPGALLDPGSVVATIAGIAEALGLAHAAGIVHGQVRPSKLLRVGPQAAKLVDLGLTGLHAVGSPRDGILPEVADYWTPEQVRGGAIDGRTDLFALAAVLFELLAGERPFAGDSVPSVLFRIVHEAPRDLARHADRVPPALGEFLGKALAKNPDHRFQDGATFAADLRLSARRTVARERTPAAAPAPDGSAETPPAPAPSTTPVPNFPSASARRRSLVPFVAATVVVAALAGAFALFGGRDRAPAAPVKFPVTVVTEPADVAVTWNGRPVAAGRIEVPAAGPFGRLAASRGCRTATYDLSAADAGRTVTLVLDPERAPVTVDAGVAGARLRVNGASAGASPRRVELDLCRANVVEASAAGYATASVAVPAGATPLEASRALAALSLRPIPRGRLVLPSSRVPLTFYVDGKRVARLPRGLDLPAGEHEVRAVNADAWIDVRTTVTVAEGATAQAELAIPPLAELVVQAFPSNARVFLRRGSEDWVFLDEVPVAAEIAAGNYRVRVEFIPTGETQEKDAVLRAGQTAQLRFASGTKR